MWTLQKKNIQKQGSTAVLQNFELNIGPLSKCLLFANSKIPEGTQMLVKFGSVGFPANDPLEALTVCWVLPIVKYGQTEYETTTIASVETRFRE